MRSKLPARLLLLPMLLIAHAAFSQQPERRVLYTLGESEKFDERRFVFSFQTPAVKYYCLTVDEKKEPGQQVSLIINGRTVVRSSAISAASEYSLIPFVDLFHEERSAYKYVRDGDYFLSYNGKEYGPYQDVKLKSDDPVLIYKQMGRTFILLPDGRVAGPVIGEISNVWVMPGSATYFYTTYPKDDYGMFSVYYNGAYCTRYNSKRTITSHPYVHSNKAGDCIFTIYDEDAKGIDLCVNGSRMNVDAERGQIMLTEGGKYAFVHYKDGTAYLNINGQRDLKGAAGSPGYGINGEGINGFCINERDGYIYRYTKNGQDCVEVNGKVVGMHDKVASYISSFENAQFIYPPDWDGGGLPGDFLRDNDPFAAPAINDRGDYAYAYCGAGKFYVSVNGRSEGPYQAAWAPKLDEKGNYEYWCRIGQTEYTVKNGKKERFQGTMDNVSTTDGYTEYGYTMREADGERIVFDSRGGVVKAENIYTTLRPYEDKTHKSKSGKDLMLCGGQYPYVMINNQKYGSGRILASGYNEALNVFRWSALEGKELVVYEYKLN